MFKVVFLLLLLNQGTHCYTSRSPPVFISQQSNVYIFNQQNLTLSCSIDTPSPTVNYTWFRGIQKLPGSMVNESGSLVIPNITEGEYASREGVDYYCIASDNISFNVAVRSRTITVYYAYFDGFERMAESNESTMEVSIPVAVNSDVALECDVLDAKPRPKIKWYDDQGEIQEIILDNSVRFLDDGRYLYLRRLQPSHLERKYYCSVTNANLIQEISAPTRYVLTDNLTQGVLMDYKQIGNWTAFIGNSSFEFAYVGGVFGSNNVNRTSNRLFMNGSELVTLGNVGKITLLSSPGIIQLRAIVRYDSVSVTRNGSVTVHQIPRIISTIQDVREHLVGEGNLTFTCQFEGSPLPNIAFYHNGAITSPGSDVKISGNILTILSPQVSHSGIYQCIVSNEFGDDQIAWFLEIRQPISPRVVPLNLTELGALEDQDVGVLIVESINSTASFFVDVEAYPCPSVVWRFNGITLGPSNITFTYNNPCIEASERSFIWTFTFNVVLTSATSGQYMANFTNINGTTSLPRIYITIPSPGSASIVSLKLSEACLIEGSNVSLRCLTNGFPRPDIEFQLNNLVIIPGADAFENFMEEYFDQLMITDVTVRAEGHYSCSVAHEQQPVPVSEEFKFCTVPHITGNISTSNPCIGEQLVIECIFSAIPVNVVWKRGEDVLNTTDDRYRIVTTPDNSSSLEVFAATSDFSGMYTCIISNNAGSDNRSFYIELRSCVYGQDTSLLLSGGAIGGIVIIGLLGSVLILIIIIALVYRHYCKSGGATVSEKYEVTLVEVSEAQDSLRDAELASTNAANATSDSMAVETVAGELTTQDLNHILNILWSVRRMWYMIGLELGLHVDDLDTIEEANKDDLDACFIDCLKHWLSQYPPPATWSTVVKALRRPAVGCGALAEEIESMYMSTAKEGDAEFALTNAVNTISGSLNPKEIPVAVETIAGILTIDHLSQILTEVWDVRRKWILIGLGLGLPISDLDEIKHANNDIGARFQHCLKYWLKRDYPTATWSAIVMALRSRTVGYEHIANRIEKKYMSTTKEGETELASTDAVNVTSESSDPVETSVANGTIADELTSQDLSRILNLLWDVRHKWFDIGIILDLDIDDLESIEAANHGKSDRCFMNCLKRWLRRPNPPATWSAMVMALRSVEFLVLADEIERTYTPTAKASAASPSAARPPALSMKLLTKWKVISTVNAQWMDLADLLDFNPTVIAYINNKYIGDPELSCREIFTRWLWGEGLPPSWEKLLEVLDDGLNFKVFADEVRSKLNA